MTCPAVPDVGAYLLGVLPPEERRQVQRHLRDCVRCRAELAELGALPALLARVDPDELRTPPVVPSPELYARVAAAAGGRRRRRLLIAAAVAALLAGGAGAAVAAGLAGAEPTTVSTAAGAVRVTVTATASGGGTALDVAIAGVPGGEECRLVVVDDDGRRHPAGEWTIRDHAWRGWTEVDAAALSDVLLFVGDRREPLRLRL